MTPAGSGQVIRSQIIKKQFGFAVSKTSPVLLIEKWNELNAALLILIGLALVKPMLESTVIIIVGVGLALFIFGIMRNQLIFSLFKKIILRFPRLKVLEESVEISRDALKALSSRTLLLEGFIFTVPAMILQAVSVFCIPCTWSKNLFYNINANLLCCINIRSSLFHPRRLNSDGGEYAWIANQILRP